MENIAYKKNYIFKRLPDNYGESLKIIKQAYDKSIYELNCNNFTSAEQKANMMCFISDQIQSYDIDMTGYTLGELSQRIYSDIAELSILTKPLADKNVMQININSWHSVEIVFINNDSVNISGFVSAEQAKDTLQRLVKEKLNIQDKPSINLQVNNVMITAVFNPIVDEDTAVVACIKKLSVIPSAKHEEIYDYLAEMILKHQSMLILGTDKNCIRFVMNRLAMKVREKSAIFVIDKYKLRDDIPHTQDLVTSCNNSIYVNIESEDVIEQIANLQSLPVFIYNSLNALQACQMAENLATVYASGTDINLILSLMLNGFRYTDAKNVINETFPVYVNTGLGEDGTPTVLSVYELERGDSDAQG